MVKETERRIVPPQPIRIPELVDQIERTKDPQKQLEMADATVKIATEKNFDAYSLMQLVDKASAIAVKTSPRKRERNIGTKMLRGVNTYFADRELVTKLFITDPNNKQNRKALSEFSTRISSAVKNLQKLADWEIAGIDLVKQFVDETETTREQAQKTLDSNKVLYYGDTLIRVFARPVDRNTQQFRTLFGSRGIQTSILALHANERSSERRRNDYFHEQLFEQLTFAASNILPGVPDYLTTEFNGVSLKQFLNEPDDDQAGYQALQLWNAVPSGDIIWREILNGIFLHSPSSQITDKNRFLIKRATKFQEWMGEKLFAPAFGIENSDGAFTEALVSLLDKVDEETSAIMAPACMLHWYIKPFMESIIRGEEEVHIINSHDSIPGVISREILDSYPESLYGDIYQFQSELLVLKKRQQIVDSLRRFGSSEAVTKFGSYVDLYISNGVKAGHQKWNDFKSVLDTNVRATHYSGLFADSSPGEKLTELDESLGMSQWIDNQDESGASSHLYFRKTSLPDQLGFEQIELFPHSGGSWYFKLLFQQTKLAMVGEVSDTVSFINVSFPPEDKPYQQVLSHLVREAKKHFEQNAGMDFTFKGGVEIPMGSFFTKDAEAQNTQGEVKPVQTSRANALLMEIFKGATNEA